MKGITLVQAFQYWLKMFAISVPIFVLMAVYGHYGAQIGWNGQAGLPGQKDAAPVSSSPRQPLPAKAPADTAWLNPFGPLSSKAAKAAQPSFQYDGALTRIDYGSAAHARFFQFINPVSELFQRSSISISEGEYESLKLIQYWVNSVQPAALLYAPSLTNTMINWTSSQGFSPRELRQKIVEVLRTNGVALQMSSGRVAQAFPIKEAKIIPFNTKPYALLYTYSLIIAIVCGTAGLPHILVRFYTNPDGVAAKRTTMWVMILIGVFYVFPPIFGVIGRNLTPELYAASGAKGTDKVVLELPRVLDRPKISATGTPETTSANPAAAKPAGVLGSILSGVACAGAFAAFMSTFSGLLVSMTGALAHDVYGRILRPKSTAEERLRAFKISAVLVGAVAVLLGTQVEQLQINFMVGQAFAIAAASYFPLLFMSVWWRGMTTKGAATGMLGGGLAALACTTVINLSDLKKIDMNDFWSAHPLVRILCEQPAIWTVPVAILLMIIVSKMTRHQVPADIRMKMLVLHAPEALGLKQEYIQEHQGGH
jgi:Na+(H+)/acetate symporter ActP